MKKFRVQATVSVEVAVEVRAASLEEALSKARELERDDPTRAGFIAIPKKVEYLWNNDTKVSGVLDA